MLIKIPYFRVAIDRFENYSYIIFSLFYILCITRLINNFSTETVIQCKCKSLRLETEFMQVKLKPFEMFKKYQNEAAYSQACLLN